MFCSEKCLKEAWNSFHNYECLIIDRCLKSGVLQIALRIYFQALNIFHGSTENLKIFIENQEKSYSMFDFDFSKNNDENLKNSLISLWFLVRSGNLDENDSPELILKDHPKLVDQWKNNKDFIRTFFQKIVQICDSNFHGICGWSRHLNKISSPQMIGVACYPFLSLLNHSCVPNVNRVYIEGQACLMVERPIKKGEQIFDCYR